MQITHTKRVCKDFEIQNVRESHSLYVQSNQLLLAEVIENFRKMYLYYDKKRQYWNVNNLCGCAM